MFEQRAGVIIYGNHCGLQLAISGRAEYGTRYHNVRFDMV